MNTQVHDEIREIIVTGGEETLSAERRSWLRDHLRACPDCQAYATLFGSIARVLKSESAPVDPDFIRLTQERVQSRCRELRGREEHQRIVLFACLFVTLSCALSMPVFWRIAAWAGHQAGVSNLVWQMGFGFFWTTPVLAASALMLARNVCWGGWNKDHQS